MRLPILLMSALILVPLFSCTENVPPPNPISLGDEAPAEGGPGSKGTGKAGLDGPAAPNWKKVGEVPLVGTSLTATVATELSCCGDADSDYQGSPARFYLGPVDMSAGGDGLMLWLDAKGHSVLSQQTDPGVYSKEIFRSEGPAKRTDGVVNLECPAKLVPEIPLYIWAGTRFPSTVLGTPLPISDPDGGIPALLLTRKASAKKKATPPSP